MDIWGMYWSWQLTTLGVAGLLLHGCVIFGLVHSLRSGERASHLRWALIGLSGVLLVALTAWIFYRLDIRLMEQALCYASGKGLILARGIAESQHSLSLGLFASLLPFVISLVLLLRGLILPMPDPKGRVDRGRARALVAATSLALGCGLLTESLFSYLDFGPFMLVLLNWWI